jgi:uncharacterized membrane protein YecN with MAPEG domain
LEGEMEAIREFERVKERINGQIANLESDLDELQGKINVLVLAREYVTESIQFLRQQSEQNTEATS